VAITVTDAWKAAVQRSDARIRFLATIEDGTSTWNALDGSSDTLAYPAYSVGLAGPPSSVGGELDPLTREVTINEIVVPFRDAYLRPIVVAGRLKGQALTVKMGAAELGAGDYCYYGSGIIKSCIGDGTGQVITVTCADPFQILEDTDITGVWIDKHPLEILYDGAGGGVLEKVGIPAALIDTAAFDPTNYTSSISHWNMVRGGDFQHWEFTLLDPTSALDIANHLAMLLSGNFLIDNQGRFSFTRFDASASVAATWTADDIISCKHVEQRGDIINEVIVGFFASGGTFAANKGNETGMLEWRDQDDDSLGNYAYKGGATDKLFTKTIKTSWINAYCKLKSSFLGLPDNTDTQMILEGDAVWGMTGMRQASGVPQPAESMVTSDRPAYFMLRGQAPKYTVEIIKVTEMCPYVEDRSTSTITKYADAGDATHVIVTSSAHGLIDGETVFITGSVNYNGTYVVSSRTDKTFEIVAVWVVDDGVGTWRLPREWENIGTSIQYHDPDSQNDIVTIAMLAKAKICACVRGQLGTIAVDWSAKAAPMVYDITMLVALTDNIIKRYGDGVDVIEVVTGLRELDKELADLVGIVDEHFVSYDKDGLDGIDKFEIIQREPRPENGEITWRVASAGQGTPNRNYISRQLGEMAEAVMTKAAIDEEITRATIGSGMQSTTTAGLVGAVSAGHIALGPMNLQPSAARAHTYKANRDTYVAWSLANKALVFYNQENGAGEPASLDPDEILLWKVVTGAAAITSHTKLYDESRIAPQLIGPAQTLPESVARNHNFDLNAWSRGLAFPPDGWNVV
jgi:hypothetical protein